MSSKTFSGIIIIFAFFLFLPIVAQGASLIDINTASLEELEEIIGIGPVLAQRIIDARPFNSLDDLIKVKGIGEITLQKIKDQGLAWTGPQEELEPKPEEETPTEAVSYPTGIVFNEILPSPEGADAENEWIEIFNTNNFEVNLSGWQIQDTVGKTTIYSLNTEIPALGFLLLPRPETKITLNNSGDGLNLIYPDGEIADSITFGKAPLGQSYNKIQSGWSWSTVLTPGAKNTIPVPESPKEKPAEQKAQQAEFLTKKESAAISTIAKSSNYFTMLIALAVAILSAIIIFVIKKVVL